MLKELLVIYTCSTGVGCSDTSAAYYQTSPELQYLAKNAEENIKDKIGETTIKYVLAPVITIIRKQDILIPVTPALQLLVNPMNQYASIGWKHEF